MFTQNDIEISILIPVYNAEPYLKKCIDSILQQEIESYEIVILDDGSVDNSGIIADEYERNNSKIRVYHQENQGIVYTRCRLLELARGNYIGWIDADDYIEKNMYKRLYEMIKEHNAEMAYCNYSFYPSSIKGKNKWFKPYKGVVDWKLLSQNTQQWNKLVSHRLLQRLNMKQLIQECGEGAYAFVFIFANGIVSTDECLYMYRVGHDSISANRKNVAWYEENVNKTKRQLTAAKQLDVGNEMVMYFEYWLIFSIIQLLVVASNAHDKEMYKKARQWLLAQNPSSNKYTKMVMDTNYGALKSFLLRRGIPSNYHIANIITKVGAH